MIQEKEACLNSIFIILRWSMAELSNSTSPLTHCLVHPEKAHSPLQKRQTLKQNTSFITSEGILKRVYINFLYNISISFFSIKNIEISLLRHPHNKLASLILSERQGSGKMKFRKPKMFIILEVQTEHFPWETFSKLVLERCSSEKKRKRKSWTRVFGKHYLVYLLFRLMTHRQRLNMLRSTTGERCV